MRNNGAKLPELIPKFKEAIPNSYEKLESFITDKGWILSDKVFTVLFWQ